MEPGERRRPIQFIQVIKRHADRLTKIVEDLLTLSKIESKEIPLKRERIEVSEIVKEMIDFLREASDKKGISIVHDQGPLPVTVQADRNLLEQVFINLLDNAIKYTPEGGRIEISSLQKGQEILVTIRDNGIGIPKEDVTRIFERFYRVDKGRSQEMGGTGLGLSIVKHIIQAHGGRVWAESEMGKGSTFFFTIPIPFPKTGS